MLEFFLDYYEFNFLNSIFLLFCPSLEGHGYKLT